MSEIAALLREALAHYQAGRHDETEDLCNRVLLLKRNEVNACHMLGMVAMQRGDLEDAVSLLDRAAIQDPTNAEIQHNHAHALKQAGRLREAVDGFRRAAKLVPESAALLTNLANAEREIGRLEDAKTHYRAALDLAPDQAEIHANYGDLLRVSGDMAAAEAACRQALALQPDLTFALVNLGAALREQGRIREALEPLSHASELDPANLWAWQQLGEVAADLGQDRLAEQALRHVLDRDADNLEAAYRLGEVLCHSALYEEAVTWLKRVVDRQADHLSARLALGIACDGMGDHEAALACFKEVTEQDPEHGDALRLLGSALAEEGRPDEAYAVWRRAYARSDPRQGSDTIRLATLLPVIPASLSAVRENRASIETMLSKLAITPLEITDPVADRIDIPYRLAFHGLDDRSARETLAGIYRSACPELAYTAPHTGDGPRRHQGRWRLGVYLGGLQLDSVADITLGLIEQLEQDRFEVIGLMPPGLGEELEARAEAAVTHILPLPGDLFRARGLISRLELDALYYPALGREPLGYFLGFARLAPVQLQGIGFPVTSGLSTIDHALTAEDCEPTGAERHYTESLERIDGTLTWYQPPTMASPARSRSELGLDEDRTIYLCPAPLDQLHPEFDAVLAEILRLDPTGELLLLAPERPLWDELWGRRFSIHHPDAAGRIRFAMQPSREDLLNMIAVSNVMLDPTHYTSDNLALDAFAVGTPVITQPGRHARSRRTYGFYRRMSLMDCVVHDPGDYVETAVTIATDRRRHATVSQAIQRRASALFEDRESVAAFETFLNSALNRWGRQDLP